MGVVSFLMWLVVRSCREETARVQKKRGKEQGGVKSQRGLAGGGERQRAQINKL